VHDQQDSGTELLAPAGIAGLPFSLSATFVIEA
jgi:hypothetical protein